MPLTTTRASASAAGYGQNLSSFPNIPVYDQGNTSASVSKTFATKLVFTADGTGAFAVVAELHLGYGNYDYFVVSYTRNVSTGELTPVSTLQFVTLAPAGGIPVTINVTPDGKFVYVSYTTSYSGTTGTNLIYQFSVNTTTKVLSALSPASITLTNPFVASSLEITSNSAFLYAGNNVSNKVNVYNINSTTGQLSLASTYTTPTGTLPWDIKLSPDNSFLYMSSRTVRGGDGEITNGILQYSRNVVTGAITPLSPEGLNTSGSTNRINMTPNGNFLSLGCQSNTTYPSGAVYTFGRNESTGVLTLASTQGGSLIPLAYSADSNRAYAIQSSTPSGGILSTTPSTVQATIDSAYGFFTLVPSTTYYSFGGSGLIQTTTPDYTFYYTPIEGMVIMSTVSGGYLIPTNTPTNGGYTGFATTGAASSPFYFATKTLISPDGKSVYTNSPNRTTAKYGTQFNRNATTGVLTFANNTNYGAQQGYAGMAISPDGTSFYSADTDGPKLWQFSRNIITGNLTPLSTPSVALSTSFTYYYNPTVSPDGKGVYVASSPNTGSAASQIRVFNRNTSTGELTYNSDIAIGTGGMSSNFANVVVMPNNTAVYAYDGYFTLGLYTRNTTTNALTQTQLYYPNVPGTFCVSPDSRFLYFISGQSGATQVITYSINQTTYALTQIATLNFTLPVGNSVITSSLAAMSPDGSAFYIGIQKGDFVSQDRYTPVIYQFIRNKSSGLVKSPKRFAPLSSTLLLSPSSISVNNTFPDGIVISPDSKQLYAAMRGWLVQVNL